MIRTSQISTRTLKSITQSIVIDLTKYLPIYQIKFGLHQRRLPSQFSNKSDLKQNVDFPEQENCKRMFVVICECHIH